METLFTPSAQLPAPGRPTGTYKRLVHTHLGYQSRRSSKGPSHTWEAWEQSDRQDLMSHSSLFSLPLWPYLPTCQKLFKHSEWHPATRILFILWNQKSAYTGSQKAECKCQFLPLGILFRFRAPFTTLPLPPEGPTTPKIKSSSLEKSYTHYSTPPLKIRPPPTSLPSPEVSSSIKHE